MPEQALWTHRGLIYMDTPGSKVLNRLKRNEKGPKWMRQLQLLLS